MPTFPTLILPIAIMLSLLTVVLQRLHFLMSLLALEATILLMMLLVIMIYSNEMYSLFILLSFGACEASLGLACLVNMSRTFGNDMYSLANTIKC